MTDDLPRIIRAPVPLSAAIERAQRRFVDMSKAAVDIGRGVMSLGGEPHSDEEALLLEDYLRKHFLQFSLAARSEGLEPSDENS